MGALLLSCWGCFIVGDSGGEARRGERHEDTRTRRFAKERGKRWAISNKGDSGFPPSFLLQRAGIPRTRYGRTGADRVPGGGRGELKPRIPRSPRSRGAGGTGARGWAREPFDRRGRPVPQNAGGSRLVRDRGSQRARGTGAGGLVMLADSMYTRGTRARHSRGASLRAASSAMRNASAKRPWPYFV